MLQIDVVEFQKRLPNYLRQVEDGEEIQISSHGRVVARLAPAKHDADVARQRLSLLRGSVILGDVVAPIEDVDWNADADHL